jgi:hypothetical protein
VHEHGNDEARLQQHEEEDESPPEHPLKVEIVDEVGEGAEHEEPDPDHQVELDRMLLVLVMDDRRVSGRLGVSGCVGHSRHLTTGRRTRR